MNITTNNSNVEPLAEASRVTLTPNCGPQGRK
jgi:hypothetical protein